ncbi:MAG: class I SAM-dependent methyltransferase [bacterium]|nr:class I SAM-dependent methyltransferase [bacterium]
MNNLNYSKLLTSIQGHWSHEEMQRALCLNVPRAVRKSGYLDGLDLSLFQRQASPGWQIKQSPLVLTRRQFVEWTGLEMSGDERNFVFEHHSKGGCRGDGIGSDPFWGMINAPEARRVLTLARALVWSKEPARQLSALVIGTGYGATELMLAQMGYQVTTVDLGPRNQGSALVTDEQQEAYRAAYEDTFGIFIKAGVENGVIDGSSVTMLVMSSQEFITGASNSGKSYDFILVDGSHLFPVAMKDVEGCVHLLAPGGIICVDDAGPAKLLSNPGSTMAAMSLDIDFGLLTFMVARGDDFREIDANLMFAVKDGKYRVQRFGAY